MIHHLEFEKLVRYDPGKSGITVQVELRLGGSQTIFDAKIDTGSTYCVFERLHGERLGIEIEKGLSEKIGTAGGSFLAFAHQLTLTVEGYEFDSTVYFAQDENFKLNVLGRHGWLDRVISRHGWLDRVIIGINDYDGKLYLSRYDSE